MIDASAIFLQKAEESLAGAESEFSSARYNNCANRCYYACFQAAIHALTAAGLRPQERRMQWGHQFVQAQLVGQLINRRKSYPPRLREVLRRGLVLRHVADYIGLLVTSNEASSGLRRTREFLQAVRSAGGGVA